MNEKSKSVNNTSPGLGRQGRGGIVILFAVFIFCFFGSFKTAEAVIVTPGVGQGSSVNSLNNGLVGWWTFDNQEMLNGTVLDKSGNGNTGNLINISTSTFYTQGKLGQAFKFDGVNDYVNAGSASSLEASAYSTSFWVYLNGSSCSGDGYCTFVAKEGATTGHAAVMLISAQKPQCYTSNSGTGWSGVTDSTTVFQLNKWYHVVCTNDGSTTRQYVNGVQEGTPFSKVYTPETTSNLSIGRNSFSSNRYLNGRIDDVRVYNRALSASEVQRLYKQGQVTVGATQNPKPNQTTLDSGLVGYWTFNNQDVRNGVALDKSGNGNNGNLMNISTSTFYTQGKFGQGVKFDGADDYVSVPATSASSITISFWFKLNYNFSSSNTGIMTFFAVYADNNINSNISLVGNEAPAGAYTNGSLVFKSEASALSYLSTNKVSWSANRWYNVVAILNSGSSMSVYIDGVLDNTVSTTNSWSSFSALTGYLGAGTTNWQGNVNFTRYLLGLVDDVRIYNRALSASEISQLYKQGQVTVGATQNPKSSQTTLDSGLVGYWTFNNQDVRNGVALDKSGNGNNGNLMNISTSTFYTQGKFGQGAKFDGTNDYMYIPNNLSSYFTNQEATFSVWLKRADHTPPNSNNTGSWYFNSAGTSNHYVWTDGNIYEGSFRGDRFNLGAGLITNRKLWHMVTITRKAGANGWKMYQNGNLLYQGDGGTWAFAGSGIKIGQSEGSYSFMGSMDDVRLYNRVLSTSEIRQLYNMGR